MSTASIDNTPVTRRLRAFFAPVDRATSSPTLFDPAQQGRFDLDAPPTPWRDLGWCSGLKRGSEMNNALALRHGAPSTISTQVRADTDATVALAFHCWGKLQLALSCGTQQMNLLATAAVALADGSTATTLVVGAAASQFAPGDLVVVDADYTGQTGFLGAGISGAYARTANSSWSTDYTRRISLNVGRIATIQDGTLALEQPLLAGAPSASMKLSRVAGFTDRVGPSFFQEWSALFVLDGEQGDRILFHYPRLQATHDAAETLAPFAAPLEQVRLAASFRALPVTDAADGETVLCYRTYLPAL